LLSTFEGLQAMRAALITLMLMFGLLAGTECVSEVMIQ
jgi:hypothetical protein|tara:strand:+ start:665 stop:778 length:114 start_codon:yes stop_codon:yes gene_type:complete